MNDQIIKALSNLTKQDDGIWGKASIASDQEIEHQLREHVASNIHQNYLEEISKHHSVEVMDHEIKRFISNIPSNGIICDAGGCWGWHWRNLHKIRPDIQIVIVDFSRGNLHHAYKFLNGQIGKNIHLVHGDATSLQFPDECFDGYWSVQTLQHIPNLDKAIIEARRILKPAGLFFNYSLNNAFLIKLVYSIMNRPYVVEGMVENHFFLRRANMKQAKKLESIFNNKVTHRYSEILFKPELKTNFMGKENSFIGKLDSMLTGRMSFLSIIARQLSFHTYK